jgi:hypothetical protein
MKNILGRRPLVFEQMEQRLALSATAMSDYVLTLGSDLHTISFLSGSGTVSVSDVLTADFGQTRGYKLGNAFNGFVDIQDGQTIFTGPVFSSGVDRDFEANETESLVTPIPQPQLGEGEIAQGIVAVAEIFRPMKVLASSQAEPTIVRSEVVETTVVATADESWKSISLTRGRDMYFEVASLSDDSQPRDESESRLSNEIAPLIYQQALLRREAERASSTTSQDRPNAPEDSSPLPAVPQQESLPAEAKPADVPADEAAIKKSEQTAQDGKVPEVDDYSQAPSPRDHVFAAWREDDELGDEAIALRTENQHGHSATWPVLAALAATGWLTRTRRSAVILPSHRQPLRRK